MAFYRCAGGTDPTGNAGVGDVLEGKTFSNADGIDKTGTMPNQGAKTASLNTGTTSYTIPAGYHNGSGKVSITTQEKTVTSSRSAQTVTPDSGKVLSKVTVNALAPTGTYTPTSRAANIDMGATSNYRYVTTTSVPNSNSGTYTYASGSTGGTVDMGATNTYRYVNAANVYAKGKADGGNRVTGSTGSTLKSQSRYLINIGFKPKYVACYCMYTGQSEQQSVDIYYNGSFHSHGVRTGNVGMTGEIADNGFYIRQEYDYDGWTFTYFACT